MAEALEPRRDELRRREAIIATHPDLRQRELIKLAGMSAALAEPSMTRSASWHCLLSEP